MARLFYGNFDVEYELAGRGGSLPQTVRRLNAELQAGWIGIAEPDDAILALEPFDDEWLETLESAGLPRVCVVGDADRPGAAFELCPWGASPRAVEWGMRRGLVTDAPPAGAVRMANSRLFSLKLEQDWNAGLPGACVVHSLDELRTALIRLPSDVRGWVLKAEFGMSGRERLRGNGRAITEPAANWLRHRVGRGESFVLEPWVERIAEAGLQFTILKSGGVVLEGVTGSLADESGVYRGSVFHGGAGLRELWQPAIELARRAAERIQALGYFGPLGIDAVQYRDAEGNARLRPLQDINARYTMGRLALGFRKLLQADETGVWLHQRWPTEDAAAAQRHFAEFCSSLPSATRVVRTSPFEIGGQPVGHGTAVLLGGDLGSQSLSRTLCD